MAIGASVGTGLPFAAAPSPAPRTVKAVVTDVDGTLMDSSHRLPEANKNTLLRCLQSKVPVIFATGKHRGPWVGALLKQLTEGQDASPASEWTLNAPGVFVQGMLVCDASGKVVHRNLLPQQMVAMCTEAANKFGWTVLAYTSDDSIVSNREDPQLARLEPLKEPPVVVGRLSDDVSVHKMLFLADPADEDAVRAEMGRIVGDAASITVAIPGMVEVLPRGASKADGVRVALELLGLQPGDALALGDGENDLEFLKMVRDEGGVAVAVANARKPLKEVAQFVVSSADDGGWSEAVERFALAAEPQTA